MYTAALPRSASARPVSDEGVPQWTLGLAAIVFTLLCGMPEGMAAKYVGPDWQNRVALLLGGGVGSALSIFALIRSPAVFGRAILAAWPLLAFALLAFVSYSWSIAPGETLKEAMHLTLFMLAGIAIAAVCSWRSIFFGIAVAGLVVGVLCLLLIPFGGLMTEIHEGALSGPFSEKNRTGRTLALGLYACVVAALIHRKVSWLFGAGGLLILLLMTTSATGLLAMGLTVGALLVMETLRRGPMRLFLGGWLIVVIGGVAAIILIQFAPDLLSVAGRDNTLTGRSEIWPAVLRNIEARPWTGFGYGAFWNDESWQMQWLWEEIRFEAQNAHNSGLEAMLGVGIPGFALLIYALLRTGILASASIYSAKLPRRRYGLPLVLMTVIVSLSESVAQGPDGYLWLAFIVVCTKAAMGRTRPE